MKEPLLKLPLDLAQEAEVEQILNAMNFDELATQLAGYRRLHALTPRTYRWGHRGRKI